MKSLFKLALCLFLFFTSTGHAEIHAKLDEIEVGDVILISLNCYICQVIENETSSPYSHSAIVIAIDQQKIWVAQALGTVHELPLADFIKQARNQSTWSVYRSLQNLSPQASKSLGQNYILHFRGLGFDDQYLWNNTDGQGQELLYCSEFVTKLLNTVLPQPLLPSPLDFKKNWQIWQQYYGGKVPQGQMGNSPGSLTDPKFFKHIMQFKK